MKVGHIKLKTILLVYQNSLAKELHKDLAQANRILKLPFTKRDTKILDMQIKGLQERIEDIENVLNGKQKLLISSPLLYEDKDITRENAKYSVLIANVIDMLNIGTNNGDVLDYIKNELNDF